MISGTLLSRPMRYELSLAPSDPVRLHDLSKVPSSVNSRIGVTPGAAEMECMLLPPGLPVHLKGLVENSLCS